MPGAGRYDPKDYKSFGVEHITGGAPNNFLILAKAEEQGKKPKFPTSPRFVDPAQMFSTSQSIGPGAYASDKKKMNRTLVKVGGEISVMAE